MLVVRIRNPPSTMKAMAIVAVAMTAVFTPRCRLATASSTKYLSARIRSGRNRGCALVGVDQLAVVYGNRAAAHPVDQIAIVRRDEDGRPARIDFAEKVHDVE